MARGSRAVVLDSMASGRVAHGERWSFTEMDSRIEVRMCGKPAFINRTRIKPAVQRANQTGVMENFDYMACMGLFAEGFENWSSVVSAINAELVSMPEVHGGVSLLSHGGCVIRYLARSASDMTRMNRKLWDAARELIIKLPAFDHRKY